MVESFGYVVAAFASGVEFLGSDDLRDSACLITDVRMPGMSGFELHHRVVAAGHSIPTIFLTAFPDEKGNYRAMKAGAVAYLSKLCHRDDLFARIHAASQPRHRRREGIMTMLDRQLCADWPETTDAHAHRRVSHAFFSDKSMGNRQASESFSPVADRRAASTEPVVSFGPFRLFPTQRLLLEGETPLRLGSRALDILIALVERPGELVCKKELMARVWPDTVVEEGNLKVHVAALRRALADGQAGHRYLATIPGRGYRFVAPVVSRRGAPTVPSVASPPLNWSLERAGRPARRWGRAARCRR